MHLAWHTASFSDSGIWDTNAILQSIDLQWCTSNQVSSEVLILPIYYTQNLFIGKIGFCIAF